MLFTGLSLHTVRYFVLFFLFNLSYIDASQSPYNSLPDQPQTQSSEVRVTISPPCSLGGTLLPRSSSHGEFGQTSKKKSRAPIKPAPSVARSIKSINRSPEATIAKKSNRTCVRSCCSKFMKALPIIAVAVGLLNTAMFYDLTMKAEKLTSSLDKLSNAADTFEVVVQGIDTDLVCAAAKALNVTRSNC